METFACFVTNLRANAYVLVWGDHRFNQSFVQWGAMCAIISRFHAEIVQLLITGQQQFCVFLGIVWLVWYRGKPFI